MTGLVLVRARGTRERWSRVEYSSVAVVARWVGFRSPSRWNCAWGRPTTGARAGRFGVGIGYRWLAALPPGTPPVARRRSADFGRTWCVQNCSFPF